SATSSPRSTTPPIPTSAACRGTIRASVISGARNRRSSRTGTRAPRRRNRRRRAARPRPARGVSRRAWPDARGLGRHVSRARRARSGPRAAYGGVDGRRRRRRRSAVGRRGERRRRAARGRARRAARRLVERLRLRRRKAHAVRRVGRARPTRRVRAHEASRRGGGRRARLDRAQLVALRLDVEELRAHDAAAGRRARRGRGRRRPAWLADLRRTSRRGDQTGHAAALRRLPRRSRRGLHVGGFCRGDLRRGEARHGGPPDLELRVRRAGAEAGLLGPAQRARRAGAPALAGRLARMLTTPRYAPTPMKILVTGGAGFIGSHFVRHLVARGDDVVVLDKLTYAGNPANLEGVAHEFHHGDIADAEAVARAAEGVQAIVNFAAETHVDRSILGPAEFIVTDVLGTQVLLDHARHHHLR